MTFRFFLLPISIFLMSLSVQSQSNLLDSIINRTDAASLVQYLASDSLKGRFTGTDESKKAADFIANELAKAGAKSLAGYNGYLMPFLVKSPFYKNVIGYNVLSALQGKTKSDETVVFSAHYDHVGTFSTNPYKKSTSLGKSRDSIYNGANDNASGVAAVILLARYFAALQNNERTLLFIVFSGEEIGLVGSEALADEIEPGQTKAVVNIEMIGRNQGRKIRPYITGGALSNLKSLLNSSLSNHDKKKYGKAFFIDDPYRDDFLFRRSDNWSFAKKGIPAHSIMLTSPHDKFYHTTGDEVKTLDFDVMAQVIQAIALACENLVNGVSAPGRVHKDVE